MFMERIFKLKLLHPEASLLQKQNTRNLILSTCLKHHYCPFCYTPSGTIPKAFLDKRDLFGLEF